MEDLLINTGLFNENSKFVSDFLQENNIQTIKDLLNYDVDIIPDNYLKNVIRGIKDLLSYKYSYRPLPFDTFLNTKIGFNIKPNGDVVVDFGIIDLTRMGFVGSEQLALKSWAKIQYIQYDNKDFTLMELMKNISEYVKETSLQAKINLIADYYDNDKKIVSGENTMSKLFYLRSKLDVVHERTIDVKNKRSGLRGEYSESRRTY